MKSKLFIASLFCLPVFCVGQNKDTLAPTLISSGGGYNVAGGVSLSYSVGEAVVTTVQNPALPNPPSIYLTQGFQQPQTANALGFLLNVGNESCLNSNDGSAFVTITGGVPPFTIVWSSNPTYNNLSIDSLLPGAYTVNVKDGNGLVSTAAFVITASEVACQIKIFNGITPNGDGHNDSWIIENIEAFPDNSVGIYNRWGTEVWSGDHYDNNKVVWRGEDNQKEPLPDGTYFYLVKISGATPQKGWVQLTR